MSIFEQATRQGLRFNSPVGDLTTEDLWSLPLTSKTARANLDTIAIALNRQIKETTEESFVVAKREDSTSQLKFDIVKHIIDIRIEEAKAAKTANDNKEKKQQILALIIAKENEQLAGQSLDDLKALASSLE